MVIEKKLEFIESKKKQDTTTKGYKRLLKLFDGEQFTEINAFVKSGDNYAEVVTGYGLVNGQPVYAFSQDTDRDGGAISIAQLKKIKNIYNLALKTGIPVIGIYDSIGARLTQGNEMLSEYSEILKLSNNLSGVIPQISLVMGTCLGTNAVLAACADFVIANKSAELGIKTNGDDASIQQAEREGIVHIVANNEVETIGYAKKLISIFPSNNLEQSKDHEYEETMDGYMELSSLSKRINNSNDKELMRKLVVSISDTKSFIEIQKNYGAKVITGFGRIGGIAVGFISSNNFEDSTIDAVSCSKAARMMNFCDAFSIPVITVVNSKGFSSLKEASMLSSVYAESTTAKVTLLVGDCFGSLYISVVGNGVNSDVTIAWPTAVISPLCPETAVQVLLNSKMKELKDPINDRKKLVEAYKETQGSAFLAASEGFVDDIICPKDTRGSILLALDFLKSKRESTLPKKHSNIQL